MPPIGPREYWFGHFEHQDGGTTEGQTWNRRDLNKSKGGGTIKTLLWNIEGLNSTMNIISEDIFDQFDISILTETMMTTTWEAKKAYTISVLAKQGPRGRPYGGITCLLNAKLSPFSILHRTDNILLITTRLCTIMGVYFQPDMTASDIIEEISTALAKTTSKETLILAGDLNCRTDKVSLKTTQVLEYLEEEGLTLVNARKQLTYLCPNGASAIDLVFTNLKDIKIKSQEVREEPLKKHLQVVTTSELKRNTAHIAKPPWSVSRKINTELINQRCIDEMQFQITEGNVDEAARQIERIVRQVAESPINRPRKAKRWFNEACYRARRLTLDTLHIARKYPTKENLQTYHINRKKYKQIIKSTKDNFQKEAEKKLIEEAEDNPYKALRPRKPKYPRNIPMDIWEAHLTAVLQNKETRPTPRPVNDIAEDPELFTEAEVISAIKATKNNKACGPDLIYNEHLKDSTEKLGKCITALFNTCLRQGTVPESWRKATVKMLYKGKGDSGDPNSYRGIALESALLKLLNRLLCDRITKTVESQIPEEQFGFRKGKSATQAIGCLQKDIEEALMTPGGKLYAAFLDYSKAFDNLNRQILIDKLEDTLGRNNHELKLVRNLLSNNRIEISDNITKSKEIQQTNGVLQGDPLSPILFTMATADVIRKIPVNVNIYLYADDMALTSTSLEDLQKAFDSVADWAERNDLSLNETKTVTMTFRKGGKEGHLTYKGKNLTAVKQFKYLGVTMQTRGTTFTAHIKDRLNAATRAMSDIRHLREMSLQTVLKLFQLKIVPVATYGLENIWTHLSYQNLADLEKVKSTYLKRALGLSKFTPSRLVYVLTGELPMVEDLRLQLLLQPTPSYEKLLRDIQRKRLEIWDNFYCTDAMIHKDWMRPLYDLRHAVTRLATHGFHFKVCKNKSYHQPGNKCECKWCGKQCDRYHAMWCEMRQLSLAQLSAE